MLTFKGTAKFTNNVKWLRINSEVDGTTATAMWPTKADEEIVPNDEVTILVIKTANLTEEVVNLLNAGDAVPVL